MQRHYSIVSGNEQKEGLAKVVELARFREAARLGGEWSQGGRSVGRRGQKQKRRSEHDLRTAVAWSRMGSRAARPR
jgi:hypothetical protein